MTGTRISRTRIHFLRLQLNLIGIMVAAYGLTQPMEYILSDGLYRIPYADGTVVEVTNGYLQHNPEGMYDLRGVLGSTYQIVAAADGWIRWIEDDFTQECWCCWQSNNFVIIEHPNGEWTNYTHMETGTVTAQGLNVGDWVSAGTVLGTEGSVGCSTGPHLHFVVASEVDPAAPFDTIGGFLNGVTRIPLMCGTEFSYLEDDESYIAEACMDDCPVALSVNQIVPALSISVKRADLIIETEFTTNPVFMNLEAGSAVVYRAGQSITLQPGFDALAGCSFRAVIRACNAY
ncbi:MAG: M23 family metallopeptidase [Saprospiraceae bacterium]|nr:M23 family metallopeptidase [Saprospiraceae bacterium]